MIELKSICKNYGKDNTEIQVLKEVTLSVDEGDFIVIRGTSGCGKSTLLNVIGLLDNNFQGSYKIDGYDVLDFSEDESAHYRNQYIGFIFQDFHLIDEYTVRENILLPFIYGNQPQDDHYIDLLAERFGLKDKMNDYPRNLSGGQKQRVAIIRAMAQKPKFIIADEPTGALDETNKKEILRILEKLNKDGKTIIVVTHDDGVESYASKTYVMRDGYVTLKEGVHNEI